MMNADDIHNRCPLSQRPEYLVFRRSAYCETGIPFWSVESRWSDRGHALRNANAPTLYPAPEHDTFVLATTFQEAVNIQKSGLHYTDAEVAIYRGTPALAAE